MFWGASRRWASSICESQNTVVFNSPIFVFLFLPLILLLYYAMPRKGRNALLLSASLLFCAWGDVYSLRVLVTSILGNYVLGLIMDRTDSRKSKRVVLGLAVSLNLALLLYFKYLKFAIANVAALGLAASGHFDFSGWHLPLGISFFTFAAIAYQVDIYAERTRADRNLVDFGLYLSHFAKLIAGPIVRYRDVAAELKTRETTLEGFAEGARRFVIGLGKKVLVANSVAVFADEAFKSPGGIDMPTAWLGIACYTIQLYFDFSGYSDMAIGLGRMFGFTFMENFNYPYISQSIHEFWRRWHISLSTWFRDYLYIPLGGNRVSEVRMYVNLALVFLLCGLWHGASWNFIVWGAYHGVFLIMERAGLGRALKRAWRPVRHLYAVVAIMIGWVFFRADDLTQAVSYLHAMFSFSFDSFDYYYMNFVNKQLLLVLMVGIIGSAPVLGLPGRLRERLARRNKGRMLSFYDLNSSVITVALVICLFIASAMQLAVSTYSPFIYAKF
jgi:alginate O-acetyltransferase complex protein AlgI